MAQSLERIPCPARSVPDACAEALSGGSQAGALASAPSRPEPRGPGCRWWRDLLWEAVR